MLEMLMQSLGITLTQQDVDDLKTNVSKIAGLDDRFELILEQQTSILAYQETILDQQETILAQNRIILRSITPTEETPCPIQTKVQLPQQTEQPIQLDQIQN